MPQRHWPSALLRPLWTLLLASIFLSGLSRAQSQPATPAPAKFEVASIHLVNPHSLEDLQKGIGVGGFSPFPTNRFFAHSMSLKNVMAFAYDMDSRYISGGPDWLDSQLYDIDAKVEGDSQITYEEIKPLVQHLLEQRFHLTVHRTGKLVSGFALIVAKGGPKLQPSKGESHRYAQILPNGVDAWDVTIDKFAPVLSRPADGPILNKTGLTAAYDIHLSYAPANDSNSTLPSFFTAVEEQLGLKLEPQKVPVDTLVIDHVDKTPTEN